MIDLSNVPCLREHFERIAAAEQEAAESERAEVQYARAPDGQGYKPTGRPAATQRNSR